MTRHITKVLLAASALTVLAAAPAASAAPVVDTKIQAVKKMAKTSAKTVKVAERGKRTRTNRTRSANRRGVTRSNRAVRTNRRAIHTNANRSSRAALRRSVNRRNLGSSFRTLGNRRGYRTNYRSNLGISFHFGTPGYSAYRWAPTAYSFYRPTFGSYGFYQRSTVCRRIKIEGWYRGHRELISVKQCSNPWNGSYIVQGSERLVGYY